LTFPDTNVYYLSLSDFLCEDFMRFKELLIILSFSTLCILAESSGFTGTYSTNWGELTLTQDGSTVSGSYTGQASGTISGVIENGRLKYEWTQPDGGKGRGYFELFDNGMTIRGKWGAGEDDSSGGVWEGTRTDLPVEEKKQKQDSVEPEGKGGGTVSI
jgi:hypothetical protein